MINCHFSSSISDLYSSSLMYNAIRLNPASLINYIANYYLDPVNEAAFIAATDRYYFNGTLSTSAKKEVRHYLFVTTSYFLLCPSKN